MLQDPIDDADFLFAANVLSPQGSTTLLMGEYILLQLLRTGQTTEDQVNRFKRRFMQLDKARAGELSLSQLQEMGVAVKRKSTSIEKRKRNYISEKDIEGAFSDVQREMMKQLALQRLFGTSDEEMQVASSGDKAIEGNEDESVAIEHIELNHPQERGDISIAPHVNHTANNSESDAASSGDSHTVAAHVARARSNALEPILDESPTLVATRKHHHHHDASDTYDVNSKELMRRKSKYSEPPPKGEELFADFDFSIDI